MDKIYTNIEHFKSLSTFEKNTGNFSEKSILSHRKCMLDNFKLDLKKSLMKWAKIHSCIYLSLMISLVFRLENPLLALNEIHVFYYISIPFLVIFTIQSLVEAAVYYPTLNETKKDLKFYYENLNAAHVVC